MNEKEFTTYAKYLIRRYLHDVEGIDISLSDIYTVWLVRVLQNNKAMLSTNVADTRYYEVTYNGDKKEFYFDSYVKEKNFAISTEEVMLKWPNI